MAISAPTSPRGYVSEAYYRDVLDDLVADLPPDLMWPLSVGTYSSMRREAHINAALNGYTLQLRRAQWQLDGRGCRPEVTKLVAEDMGLLIAGSEETGSARIRGVSWNDHLRAALLYLTFGHAGFELTAKLQDGKARLVSLSERLPNTISNIYADPQSGEFLGVTQTMSKSTADKPQIPADRMAWYCHEREGASWTGVSILRSIFPAFIVKREMLKVHALANRRWGMGVPVMEALPGTNPSPEQMNQAMQLAAAARAGEQAGAATPPGFAMKIMGISGSVPSTLDFLRFLNQEISSGLLMPHMDLGSTPNGSRALGESFTNSWMLALGSLGSEICDVATRQIAARIVEWNFGADEPVPSVVVSGIGEQREATAESLQLLLTSGALAADPALEAWVRREYRLPERDASAPVVTPGADLKQPAQTDTVGAVKPDVAVSAKASVKAARPEQMTLFAAAGTTPEPDFAQIQQQWVTARDQMLTQWPKTAAPMVNELAAQAEQVAEDGDLGALGTLAVSAGVLAAVALVLNKSGKGLAALAAAGVVAEAAAQGVALKAPARSGAERVRQSADAIAGIIASGYAAGAARAALQVAGADPATVRAAVEAHLSGLSTTDRGFVAENVGALLSSAQNAGRLAVLERAKGARFQAREVNDKGKCEPCSEIDKVIFDSLADAVKAYPSSGFKDCAGGLRCRGGIFPLWN